MKKANLDAPELYINRELSWLEFNDRVLREGLSEDVPLLERVKFLAIVSSNLDEFFLVRVAGLLRARAAGRARRDSSGMSPAAQLTAVSQRVHRMVRQQADGVREALVRIPRARRSRRTDLQSPRKSWKKSPASSRPRSQRPRGRTDRTQLVFESPRARCKLR